MELALRQLAVSLSPTRVQRARALPTTTTTMTIFTWSHGQGGGTDCEAHDVNRLEPGLVLGDRYRLEARIASGGMGDVWVATDTVLQRLVALKVMRPHPEHQELFALRFRDEALHSARLIHTNIATVFDYGEDQGLAFLVMELVEGKPLSRLIRESGGPLPADQVRSVMGQCALGSRRCACRQTGPPRRQAGQ